MSVGHSATRPNKCPSESSRLKRIALANVDFLCRFCEDIIPQILATSSPVLTCLVVLLAGVLLSCIHWKHLQDTEENFFVVSFLFRCRRLHKLEPRKIDALVYYPSLTIESVMSLNRSITLIWGKKRCSECLNRIWALIKVCKIGRNKTNREERPLATLRSWRLSGICQNPWFGKIEGYDITQYKIR